MVNFQWRRSYELEEVNSSVVRESGPNERLRL